MPNAVYEVDKSKYEADSFKFKSSKLWFLKLSDVKKSAMNSKFKPNTRNVQSKTYRWSRVLPSSWISVGAEEKRKGIK